jgi:hypothetical protein
MAIAPEEVTEDQAWTLGVDVDWTVPTCGLPAGLVLRGSKARQWPETHILLVAQLMTFIAIANTIGAMELPWTTLRTTTVLPMT